MNELDNCNSHFRVYIKLMSIKLIGKRSWDVFNIFQYQSLYSDCHTIRGWNCYETYLLCCRQMIWAACWRGIVLSKYTYPCAYPDYFQDTQKLKTFNNIKKINQPTRCKQMQLTKFVLPNHHRWMNEAQWSTGKCRAIFKCTFWYKIYFASMQFQTSLRFV